MVAVIKVGSSINRTFHYNENKVKEGCAELLMVGNYPAGTMDLNASQRLNMLLRTAESNPNVKANSVHISLNFAVGETLDNDKLRDIAREYMDAIGFGKQPYLVYRHDDAAHPHIHIATVKVDLDGRRIETQNIGKNLSEPARKAIEQKYGLVKAEDHRREVFRLKPVDVTKVQYGKSETRRAIANVLDYVINNYKFTSLPELNAVLNLYNVSAERGSENSGTYKAGGLIYRILDTQGKLIGVPIKASLFHNKPTLSKLEKYFLRNNVERQQHKQKLKSSIDFALKTKRPKSLNELSEALRNTGIKVVVRQSKDGLVYGLTFIDFKSKCVFNGSDLGKEYSAKALQEKWMGNGINNPDLDNTTLASTHTNTHKESIIERKQQKLLNDNSFDISGRKDSEKSLAEELMQHEFATQQVPFQWRKKKRKKKKR